MKTRPASEKNSSHRISHEDLFCANGSLDGPVVEFTTKLQGVALSHGVKHTPTFPDQLELMSLPPVDDLCEEQYYQQRVLAMASPATDAHNAHQQQQLTALLGNLKIDEVGSGMNSDRACMLENGTDVHNATAPYLTRTVCFAEEGKFVEDNTLETWQKLPFPSAGSKICTPPILMPDNDTASRYIDLYFLFVHPYVPVLNQPQFIQQWQSSRDSISPLILEAIFAIGACLAKDTRQGHQWLALASCEFGIETGTYG